MKTQLLLIVTLSVLLGACQKDPNSLIEPNGMPMQTSSIDDDSNLKDTLSSDAVKYIAYMMDSSLISEDEALMNLNQLMQRNASRTRSMGKAIKSIRPMYLNHQKGSASKSENAVAYTIEYENNQGFAIVAADRRIAPIICVVEDGSFDGAYEVPGLSTLLENMDGYLAAQIDRFNELRDSLKNIIEPMEKQNRGFTDFGPSPIDPEPGTEVDHNTGTGLCKNEHVYEYTDWIEKLRIEALINVRWHQDYPYNAYADIIYCKDHKESHRARAGCVAIAMAQTMAYHKKPSSYKNFSYNWDQITISRRITDSTDIHIRNQVSNLVRTIGSEVNTKYGCQSSTSPFNVRSAFNNMGYSAPTALKIYDRNDVIASVKNYSPVLMFGAINFWGTDGHTWIIDGYIFREQYVYYYCIAKDRYGIPTKKLVARGSTGQVLFNNNWGWDGYNGFFDASCFDYTKPIIPDTKQRSDSPDEFDWHLHTLCNIK